MSAVEEFAGDLVVSAAAWAIVLGIFVLLLGVVGPILVASLGVEVVKWVYSLVA